MKKFSLATLCLILTVQLVGCAEMSKEDMGTLTGGLVGGVLGSEFGNGTGKTLMIAAGAMAGAYFGNQVGRQMDAADQRAMTRALNTTPDGEAVTWVNNRTGNRYTVEPTRSYEKKTAKQQPTQYCREFSQAATIEGSQQTIYGRACKPVNCAKCDWRVVETPR